jgi:hypothetical protein
VLQKKRRAGGMAQAVEYLPSRYEALNSNPSTTKKITIIKSLNIKRGKKNMDAVLKGKLQFYIKSLGKISMIS